MIVTLVLTAALHEELERAASNRLEVAGVLLVKHVPGKGAARLLGQSIFWVPTDGYIEQYADGLVIGPEGYLPALAEAERTQCIALWLHTHPGLEGIPTPSRHDSRVDEQISDLFQIRTDSGYFGTLIISPRPGRMVFTGKLHDEDGHVSAIDRLWVVGDEWQLTHAYDSELPPVAPMFSRNVRAFGEDIQTTLGNLSVGIVGCGGTGSSVAEQIVRLGVRTITIIDPDVLSETNITRVYGSTAADIGKPKVEIIKAHLAKIAPNLQCKSVLGMITMETVARELTACDVLFGCTDDNAGRIVLSRLSTYLLIPTIDIGILLSSDGEGNLFGIDGRVTVLSPGAACLICRNRIDLARAASELLTPDERRRLENEGYAPALGGIEPAVVAFTTGVAAAAVAELLERIIGYGPAPRPSEILLRWHEREISTNRLLPRVGHYCDLATGKVGWGDSSPFLDQVWATS